MNKAFYILAVFLLLLGTGLVLLPDREHSDEASPGELLSNLRNPSRFISTDKVAEMIISQDPALLLVDVRDMYDFLDYSLPGAHSIPLEEIMMYNWVDSLSYKQSQIVLFSNSDILADQAWVLLKRKKYENIHIMKGGLNHWFETIIQPEPPAETAADDEIDRYQFRKGASIYFTGGAVPLEQETSTEAVMVKRKNKTQLVEGGC
ncbi:MAG: rhodanese-like domain-containing protein [Bacteroidales bacterium]|nr:rhodanese-like domain-containing protein [Bacteroidales bacterium]